MGHRAKHRDAALMRRVRSNRRIRSDLTPAGVVRWKAAHARLMERARAVLGDMKAAEAAS